MIARSSIPARWAAVFLTMQNVSQFAFAAILPATVMERFGANGGFIALAMTALLALMLAPVVPASFAELPRRKADEQRSRAPFSAGNGQSGVGVPVSLRSQLGCSCTLHRWQRRRISTLRPWDSRSLPYSPHQPRAPV